MSIHRPRKRRPRSHVLADLAVNHLERFIFRCGYSRLLTHGSDYGIDLIMWTFAESGEIDNGDVRFQVKATDRLILSADGRTVSVLIEVRDLNYWLGLEPPVILVLYDGPTHRGFWLDVKDYAHEHGWHERLFATQTLTVRIPVRNRVNAESIRRMRRLMLRMRG